MVSVQLGSGLGFQCGVSLLPSELLSPCCAGYLWLFKLGFLMFQGDLSYCGGLMCGL